MWPTACRLQSWGLKHFSWTQNDRPIQQVGEARHIDVSEVFIPTPTIANDSSERERRVMQFLYDRAAHSRDLTMPHGRWRTRRDLRLPPCHDNADRSAFAPGTEPGCEATVHTCCTRLRNTFYSFHFAPLLAMSGQHDNTPDGPNQQSLATQLKIAPIRERSVALQKPYGLTKNTAETRQLRFHFNCPNYFWYHKKRRFPGVS